MKDYRRALHLDFSLIAAAQAYYEVEGFAPLPVPWVVGDEAYSETKPDDALPYATLGGYLVGSAEQSFLQLMLDGERVGRAQATTPCFRDESHDTIHSPYFMKTELIDTVRVSEDSLHSMIGTALCFFNRYVAAEVLDLQDGTYDIVEAKSQLELGSYGTRVHDGLSWVYGTGLALPRLSQAMLY